MLRGHLNNLQYLQTMQATFQRQNFPWIIFLLWHINLWAVLCVNIVHRTMWWYVPSKKRPTYISPERGVRRCEDVALYCWWWKTKWAIRLSTRLSPSNNPDPPTPSWTSPRVLYEITTCTTSKSIRIRIHPKYSSQKEWICGNNRVREHWMFLRELLSGDLQPRTRPQWANNSRTIQK